MPGLDFCFFFIRIFPCGGGVWVLWFGVRLRCTQPQGRTRHRTQHTPRLSRPPFARVRAKGTSSCAEVWTPPDLLRASNSCWTATRARTLPEGEKTTCAYEPRPSFMCCCCLLFIGGVLPTFSFARWVSRARKRLETFSS